MSTTETVELDGADDERPALTVVPTPRLGIGLPVTSPIGQSDGESGSGSAPTRETRARARRVGDRTPITVFFGRVAAWANSHMVPPDFIRKPQPSLLQVFNKARWGDQNPIGGLGRVASIVLDVLLAPFGVAFRYLAWVFENPSRLAIHVGAIWTVEHTPYLSNVLDAIVAVITIPLSALF